MSQPPTRKKVVFKGNEPVIDSLITEAFRGLDNTTLYDQTSKINKAIELEKALLKKGYLDPETAPDFSKRESRFDLECEGRGGFIELRAGKQRQRIKIPEFETMREYDMFLRDVVRRMRLMLRNSAQAPSGAPMV